MLLVYHTRSLNGLNSLLAPLPSTQIWECTDRRLTVAPSPYLLVGIKLDLHTLGRGQGLYHRLHVKPPLWLEHGLTEVFRLGFDLLP